MSSSEWQRQNRLISPNYFSDKSQVWCFGNRQLEVVYGEKESIFKELKQAIWQQSDGRNLKIFLQHLHKKRKEETSFIFHFELFA